VPLFRQSEDKIAKEAAAQAEFERLNALSPADLAVEVMPAFGPDGPRGHGPNGGINILQALFWLNQAHFPSGISYISQLQEPVREAIQALDHAGLVLTNAGREGSWTSATRLGLASLADGTLSQRVGGTAGGMELPPLPSAG
jgi:hypothetical protein